MSKQKGNGMPSGVKRPGKITQAKREQFLSRLAETCNVTLASREAGLDFSGLYRSRRTDPAFAAQWAEAVEDGYMRIETELMQRALGSAGAGTAADGTATAGGVPIGSGAEDDSREASAGQAGEGADGDPNGAAKADPATPFDPVLALKVLVFKRRADPQQRRSGVKLKQPNAAEALAALEAKLSAMERRIERDKIKRDTIERDTIKRDAIKRDAIKRDAIKRDRAKGK